MASIEDVLLSLFQGAGVPAQEAADKVAQYAPLALKAGKAALGPLGSLVGDSAEGAGMALDAVPPEAGPAALPGQIANLAMPSSSPATPPPASAPAPTPAAPPAPSPVDTSAGPSTTPSTAASAPAKPPMAPMLPSTSGTSSDEATRQAQLAAANKKANLTSAIGGSIAGIGDTLAGGLRAFKDDPGEKMQGKVIEDAQNQLKTDKANIETGISNDPNSDASKSARQLVLQIAPQMANQPGFNTMTDQELRDKLPLVDTMMKARAAEDAKQLSMEQIKSNRDISLGLRRDQQQDKLEQNAKQMVANLRGDKSLSRAEEQRDAAIVAYNRLDQIQKSGEPLNPVDYVDILGQLYKARTGAAPGEQVLKDIRQSTAEGNLGKAYTYITGNQAPATSQAITSSLKSMAQSMGQQADKFHQGYMNSHLIKPSDLEDSRWKPILDTGRGVSFADATKAAPSTPGSQTSSDPLGIR